MATIDIIILIIIGAGAIVGFMKGFIRQLASILGLIVGLLAAKALYTTLAEKLCPTVTDSMTVAQVLAFIIIWIAVPLIFFAPFPAPSQHIFQIVSDYHDRFPLSFKLRYFCKIHFFAFFIGTSI